MIESETQACDVPLIEQLRSIPKDYRAVIAIQWAEDGRETGHRLIPVGVLTNRAADEMLLKDRKIAELERNLSMSQATVKHYEAALYMPGLKPVAVANGNDAIEIIPIRVTEIIKQAEALQAKVTELEQLLRNRNCDDLCLEHIRKAEALQQKVAERDQWVNDLQSGMYVNCVYCGHRYGPQDKVPATMADALKEHIEQCPKHPMSKLKARAESLQSQLADFRDAVLNNRGALAENGMTNDQVNDVLAEFDGRFPDCPEQNIASLQSQLATALRWKDIATKMREIWRKRLNELVTPLNDEEIAWADEYTDCSEPTVGESND